MAELLKWRRADQDEILRTARTVRRFVFRLVGVELWCRLFLDGDSPAVLTDQLQRQRHLAQGATTCHTVARL